MSLPATAAFRAAVAGSHGYARELWVCDATGNPIESVPVLPESTIQVQEGLVRRTAQIVLPALPRYIPQVGGLIGWNTPLRFRYGADGEWVEMPLLWPDEQEYQYGGSEVRLGCYDALRVVNVDSKLADGVTFTAGSGLAPAFRRLLEAVGAPTDDDAFDFGDGGASFTVDSSYEPGSYISQILGQWLIDYRLDLYVMPPARYTLRPIVDPLTAEPVATWALGREVRLLGFNVRSRNGARNHARVQGLDADGVPFVVDEYDLNPDSPVRFGAPGIPDLPVEWQSDSLATIEDARAVARSLLVRNRIIEEVDATVPMDPSLDRFDVVAIDGPRGTSGRFSLDSFAVPAAPGSHVVSVRRERSLDA